MRSAERCVLVAQGPGEILATSGHAVWRSHNCKARRPLRIREYVPFLLEGRSLRKKDILLLSRKKEAAGTHNFHSSIHASLLS